MGTGGVMNARQFRQLVEGLGRAWEVEDARAAADYFAEDGEYSESPGWEAVRGREAIRRHFEAAASRERSPDFIINKTVFCGDEGAVEWTYVFISADTGQTETYRGVAMAEVRDGKLKSWREYGLRV